MIEPQQLEKSYALNLHLVKLQTEGLSHEDSLCQPPFRGNCMNWVVGHIVFSRERVLKLLGEDTLLSAEATVRYETGSEPVTGQEEGILPLEKLLELLECGQEKIGAGFDRITEEELKKEIQIGERTMTVGQRLFGLYFHETYHTGQTELLRQLAGKNDKVV